MKSTEQKRGNNGGITAQLLPVTQELMQPKRDLQTSIATTQA
ncbi:hypothetical protein [Bifidobacterium pseudocatenulatum]|nr:hypothetical protein [Bifidobacterium pseudocatenulatum]MDB6517430.1 hypothetical protein [Bifidobacterium pseudocatenulatum]MDB6519059.1 hypothetical protein [Bifidobacterium pseudocatenulatum]MDB6520787.1 hypothetical protein [Bifidobacterium pseudocatenulatum]MDB6522669.1 hypothetical protein [Bifidobacterium pseudocatenulatum]MDB6524438.1 hypothetical protein [Bifidobacterium pseudocatenulatum]